MAKKEPLEATLYLVDGTTETVSPNNGYNFTLKELQSLVEGYIEMSFVLDGENNVLIFDEDGKMKGLQVNERATEIFSRYNTTTELVGPVLMCKRNMIR